MTDNDNRMVAHESEATDKIYPALVKAMASTPNPTLDMANSHFGNRYSSLKATLAAVTGPAKKAGIIIVQFPASEPGSAGCRTKLVHTSGQWIGCTLLLDMKRGGPQDAGSCITYARRYSLQCLFSLVGDDDDDGNAAQSQYKKSKPKPKPSPKKKADTSFDDFDFGGGE
jgi:hypothetical protein